MGKNDSCSRPKIFDKGFGAVESKEGVKQR